MLLKLLPKPLFGSIIFPFKYIALVFAFLEEVELARGHILGLRLHSQDHHHFELLEPGNECILQQTFPAQTTAHTTWLKIYLDGLDRGLEGTKYFTQTLET